ncbi:hypothetical protein Moror_8579 [Moniliophthora roreri MCA 2997]|uniref:Uncharacterized protein n=1 Tax=Moniliophthora roreri (strain MCA 2997) TaxID=1381753 RepID=V2WQD2_MONRO|nr:hypothetical protein Moror_8579 [Moniliophthora roreri MCA 2997]
MYFFIVQFSNNFDYSLQDTYTKHAKCLHQTGGGVGQDENEDTSTTELDFYIAPEGPNHTTSSEAHNIWNQIVGEFKFFPCLHHILSTQSNVTLLAVTTGVTPHGHQTILLQQPDNLNTIPDELIDSVLCNLPPTTLHSLSSNAQLTTPPLQSMLSASQVTALASIFQGPRKRGFDEMIGDVFQQHVTTS